MQIPFDTYPTAVKSENKWLRRSLGVVCEHPRYQWAWSEDLLMPMVVLADFGAVEMDYHCVCGVNVSIHNSSCNFTAPRPKWEMRKLTMAMKNKWVMTCWKRPEATQADWERLFGGTPYPAGGYYSPVGTATQCLAVHSVPFRQTSEAIAKAIKEHFSKTSKQRNQDTRDNWDRMDAEKIALYKDMLTNAFPVHSGKPGQKEDWSAGGIGPSPVVKKLELAKV